MWSASRRLFPGRCGAGGLRGVVGWSRPTAATKAAQRRASSRAGAFAAAVRSNTAHARTGRVLVAAPSRLLGTRAGVPGDPVSEDGELQEAVSRFARYIPHNLTLGQYTAFGQRNDDAAKIDSSVFVHNEVRTRLAHMISELRTSTDLLAKQDIIKRVYDVYIDSFRELNAIDNLSGTATLEEKLAYTEKVTEAIGACRRRHTGIPLAMAHGVLQLKQDGLVKGMSRSLNEFLDRFYMSRVAMRFLNAQHLALFGEAASNRSMVGSIEPACDVRQVVLDAAEHAGHMCEEVYFQRPPVEIITPCSEGVHFTYVPGHLYHITFELLKNSFRAVAEFHGPDATSLPPVRVVIVKGKQDVSIKISDEGGGISRSHTPDLFSYLYTTAEMPALLKDVPDSMDSAPLAGFGYGLPMSRLYARYFGGNLHVISMEGFGTDAFVFLCAAADDAGEVLPVFRRHELSAYLSKQGMWMRDEPHWMQPGSS
eukprot:m.160040 g.160040  ORF g.160040 m.160040 type:complete len:481 (-) comp17618_c0_seq1:114-1556(-)